MCDTDESKITHPYYLVDIQNRIYPLLKALEHEVENIALECEIHGVNELNEIETLRLLGKQRTMRKHLNKMFGNIVL